MARIALVDDDPAFSRLIAVTLTQRGHEIVTFQDGGEGLLGILEGGFDLVLSDVQMPHVDGLSLCRALRASYSRSQLPILLLSAGSREEDVLGALEAGANDYLIKPFLPQVLAAKVTHFLRLEEGSDQGPVSDAWAETAEIPLLAEETPVFPHPFDGYDLLAPLGQGGFSLVYRAVRRGDGLPVAIKLLRTELHDDRAMLARYFREVAVLSQIESPHVVRVLDSGRAQGRYFLVMELVPGKTSHAILKQEGPFTVPRLLRLASEVCLALSAFQARGLVHRDIKPDNILVRPDGQSTLIDFGLAKGTGDQGLTAPNELLGTAEFLAPEVIRGGKADIVSDCYSLGATLYELASGQTPFVESSSIALLKRVSTSEAARPLTELCPGFSQPVSDLVAGMLCPDPARRLGEPKRLARTFQELCTC